MRFRGRSKNSLSELPTNVVPWLEMRPLNGHPSLTDQGAAIMRLFLHVCVSLAPLATTCVIVELLFSQMKIVQMANETSSFVDDELMLIFNTLRDLRKLFTHTKGEGSSRHLHTKEQIQTLCAQALEMLERYRPESMAAALSKRTLVGSHKATDMATARHCAIAKGEKRDGRRAAPRSSQDWDAAQAAVQAAPHAVQVEGAALKAITRGQRVVAVVMEEKNRGHANGETKFWSKL